MFHTTRQLAPPRLNKKGLTVTQTGNKPRILIVGGGAGGLELAVKLGEALGKPGRAAITLVDRSRTHVWKPLLHQVAAGTLDSHSDELEYLALSVRHHFHFRLGELVGLDRDAKEIHLAPVLSLEGEELLPESRLGYDYLVFALGSLTNDFGTPGAREHCISLDSAPAALHFQRKLIDASLRAQLTRPEQGPFHGHDHRRGGRPASNSRLSCT